MHVRHFPKYSERMLKLDLTFSPTPRPPSPGEPIPGFCALFRNMLAYASMYEYVSYTIFFFYVNVIGILFSLWWTFSY